MKGLLALSNAINALLRTIAHIGAWFFIACIVTICFDVLSRKFGYQLSIAGIDLGSTRLQELEWHFHGMLFLTWIGYVYVLDNHVRIDIVTGTLSPRTKAWLEVIGCVGFALPYLAVATPFAHDFFLVSYMQHEGSSAPNGLPLRWVIKGFLYFGFWSVLLAVVSVLCRRIVFLFGSPALAEAAMPGAAAATH